MVTAVSTWRGAICFRALPTLAVESYVPQRQSPKSVPVTSAGVLRWWAGRAVLPRPSVHISQDVAEAFG
jgi:hypothetical protein